MGENMKFYRVIHKTTNCNVVLAIFIYETEASDYCKQHANLYNELNFYIDTVNGNQEISTAFLGE